MVSVPNPERGDAGGTVDAEHTLDPELAAHDEHGGVDVTGSARNRWNDE